jgi:hypothetical protein
MCGVVLGVTQEMRDSHTGEVTMIRDLHHCSDAENAAIDMNAYLDPWLALWRAGSLLLVEPWDNALRAYAERAQLLPRRMAALDLDPDKVARAEAPMVRELVERCTACNSPEECEQALRQDPADRAWQTYCPNASALMTLTMLPQFRVRTSDLELEDE